MERWLPTVIELISKVLNTPLGSCSLSQINPQKRLNELEFYYPLSKITNSGLQAIFPDNSISNIDSVRGFMKGYIDMVFEYEGKYYVVDYKSNMLGNQQADYHWQELYKVMVREDYILQYHIYSVALHRYLAYRLPDYNYATHFGGVYYLFLRGMQWDSEYGIYWDRPNIKLIQKLSDYFAGGV